MTDPVSHGYAIATRLRAEAAIADRPGQMNRLEAEADSVEDLADAIAAVLAIHHKKDFHTQCNNCGRSWPCATVRACGSSDNAS